MAQVYRRADANTSVEGFNKTAAREGFAARAAVFEGAARATSRAELDRVGGRRTLLDASTEALREARDVCDALCADGTDRGATAMHSVISACLRMRGAL